MFSSSSSISNKLRSALRICLQRAQVLQKKKTELGLKKRAEVAEHIKLNKVDMARIKVEHIIREDYIAEVLELLAMYCELIIGRFALLNASKTVDPGLAEAVSTLVWCAPRLQAEIPELKTITDQVRHKFTKPYIDACLSNSNGTVNSGVMQKLNVISPPVNLIEQYMVEIAKSYEVPFTPDKERLTGGLAKDTPTALAQDLDNLKHLGFDGDPRLPEPAGLQMPMLPNAPPSDAAACPPPTLPGATMPKGYEDPVYEELFDMPPPAYKDERDDDTKKDPIPPCAPDNSEEFGLPDLPDVPVSNSQASCRNESDDGVNFDDLNARFNNLKKK